MKRSLAYVAIAVVLGVAMMFAPLLPFLVVSTPAERNVHGEQPSPANFALSPERLSTLPESSEYSAGVTPHYPMDAISAGLIVLFGLVFALLVSNQWKRKSFHSSSKR
jgi:ABC-type sugar transport system permease subunit